MPEPVTSSRQERRKARTRGQILDAAEELFARGDPEAATIARIAEAADVAVATVYKHFAGKDDLHLAVVERALGKNERHMLAVYSSDTLPVLKLIDALGAYLRFGVESPRLFRLVALPQGDPTQESTDGPVAVMLAERVQRMTQALADVVEQGVTDGSLRPLRPMPTARFLWGALNGVVALTQRPDPLRLDDAQMRAALAQGAEILFDGMLAGSLLEPDGRMSAELRIRLHHAVHAPSVKE